jgi:putative transposase
MDSKNSPAPLGGEKTGKNPTDRGKRGAKINLLVDQSGAPLSVVLTGANRHDKVSAVELIVSIAVKRPAQKEQHLCADQAYDASDVREFASSGGGYTTHIKINPRKKDSTESSGRSSQQKDSHGEPHPARRWVVERTISWLTKRRSLRTRWSKKAQNWLALIQLACAHVLLNLAVFGYSLRQEKGPRLLRPGPLCLSLLPQCYGAGLPLAHHRQVVGYILLEFYVRKRSSPVECICARLQPLRQVHPEPTCP